MGKWIFLAFLALSLAAPAARAGDEDVKKNVPAAAAKEPEPTPLPEEPESPEMSLGSEPEVASPEFELAPQKTAARKSPGKSAARKNPDLNLDYNELLDLVRTGEASRGVLPPALGSRGYRPNLVAVGYGDRTPGYGALVEYSWNRLGAGVFYSYRNLKDADLYSFVQTFGGLYGIYRWLPFAISPYFLVGLEFGSKTAETFGGMLGLGAEAQVYQGWTLFLGYTYHSTARKGFLGGGAGWAF